MGGAWFGRTLKTVAVVPPSRHWTYDESPPEGADLEQGDIIEVGDDVVPGSVDIGNLKPLAWAIATQSCDLVRRRGQPKARFISVVPICDLSTTIAEIAEHDSGLVVAGLLRESSRVRFRELLERILDQNEQGYGFFYIHSDPALLGIATAVAHLRVKVAVRSEIYDAIVKRRRGRLTAEFRAKFGWLLGNLYARAATQDWSDRAPGQKEKLVAFELKRLEFVEDTLVDEARRLNTRLDMPIPDLRTALEKIRPKTAIQQVRDLVEQSALAVLKPNPVFNEKLRQATHSSTTAIEGLCLGDDLQAKVVEIMNQHAAGIREAFGSAEDRASKIANKVQNSAAISNLVAK